MDRFRYGLGVGIGALSFLANFLAFLLFHFLVEGMGLKSRLRWWTFWDIYKV